MNFKKFEHSAKPKNTFFSYGKNDIIKDKSKNIMKERRKKVLNDYYEENHSCRAMKTD